MKKAPVIIISIVILLALIGLGVYLVSQRKPATTPSTMPEMNQPSMNQPTQGQNQTPEQTSGNGVDIQNFAFSPASLTVKKGTTVKWTNYDDTAHTVTESDKQTGPSSPLLAKNQTYSFTFNQVGTFAYKCSIHPNMTGTVTVTE